MAEELDFLNADRVKKLKEQIKNTSDEHERLTFINQLFEIIQSNSESIVNKMEDGISISNFDEVKASLHNEFKNNVSKLLRVLKDIKLSNDEQASIILALNKTVERQNDDSFQTIKVKKPSEKTLIANFEDFLFPESFDIKNIEEITKRLDELRKAFKLPAPIVNVPKITIPAAQVKIPPTNFAPLLSAITDLGNKIKSIKVGGSTKIDKEVFKRFEGIEKGLSQAFAGFPGVVKLASNSRLTVKSPNGITSGRKAVTTAGTAEQITATSTPCSYVLVSSDEGNTGGLMFVGDSSVDATSGAQQGVPVPGPAAIRIDISNLNQLWVDSQIDGDELYYAYFA